jgi:hypothetical protein
LPDAALAFHAADMTLKLVVCDVDGQSVWISIWH